MEPKWLVWAREIQATAQTGLAYTKDVYDRQRYERLQQLASIIMAESAGIGTQVVEGLFAEQRGYATPKVDVRAAAFDRGRILLVREVSDGAWTLPGGWADVNESPAQSAVREVLLSGGAIGSPHILQLSGVGDPVHLGRIGVPVVHALPGVGKNLQDHFLARVTAEIKGAPTANEKSRGLPFLGELARYVLAGQGLLTYAASLVCASVKVLEESATPDVQILFANASFAPGPIRKLDSKPGMTGGMWQMRPLSRGYVEAKTNNPMDGPAINPRYLSDETDRRCAIGGLRAVRKLFTAPALKPYLVAEMLPGADVQSDASSSAAGGAKARRAV